MTGQYDRRQDGAGNVANNMSASAQPLLRLEGIKKVFFTEEVETHALAGIHLEVNPADYVSIAGPSGCGKSTLLSILGLLDSPTEGFYTLNGRPVANLESKVDLPQPEGPANP